MKQVPFTQPEPNKNGVPKLGSDSLPARLFYSLEEAAKIAKCEAVDLLHYGGIGRVTLVVTIPDSVDLCPFNVNTKLLGDPFLPPEFLIISQSHCRKIECNGTVELSEFRMGYAFGLLNPVRLIFPGNDNPQFDDAWCVWKAFSQSKPTSFTLAIDRVFVMAFDLDAFLNGTLIPENDVPLAMRPKFEEYRSEKLTFMNQAARKFWGNVDPSERAKFRKNEEIVTWLTHPDRGFSTSLAKSAASIIRPEYAGTGRPTED
jgi:hypothetical protein